MTLIVARIEAESIIVISDTKLSLPEDMMGDRKDKIGLPSSGVIKTALLNSNVAISFAGGEVYAEQALQLLASDSTVESILDILLITHLDSREATDFILAIGGAEPKLFTIKESRCTEYTAGQVWIGSKNAYTKFQDSMHGNAKTKNIGTVFKVESIDNKEDIPVFSEMKNAMDYVIDNPEVPEVGGFRVSALYDKGLFSYIGYFFNYSGYEEAHARENNLSYSFSLQGGRANDGGYGINFFNSNDIRYVGVYIPVGNLGIIYKRENSGLMRPDIIYNIEEEDFVEYTESNFNLIPASLHSDYGNKYIIKGDEMISNHMFNDALLLYNKAFKYADKQRKAALYYRKAIIFVCLKNYTKVLPMLNKAIENDSKYQKIASELMNNVMTQMQRGDYVLSLTLTPFGHAGIPSSNWSLSF